MSQLNSFPENRTTDPAIPAKKPSFGVNSYGLSDRGTVRSSNEDCFVIAELARSLRILHSNVPQTKDTFCGQSGHVFLVADGVGGRHAGEVASSLSVITIEDYLLNTLKRFAHLETCDEQAALLELQNAFFRADSYIFEEAANHPEKKGMGTTLTLAIAVNGRLFVVHAGDTRCYLFSGGRMQQITKDHTLIAEMVRQGIIAPQSQATHPWRHVLSNALGGTEPGVYAEVHSLDLHADDVILLCSDGLTEMVSDDNISAILSDETEPQRACERLIGQAIQHGGKDNITAIVARIKTDDPPLAP